MNVVQTDLVDFIRGMLLKQRIKYKARYLGRSGGQKPRRV